MLAAVSGHDQPPDYHRTIQEAVTAAPASPAAEPAGRNDDGMAAPGRDPDHREHRTNEAPFPRQKGPMMGKLSLDRYRKQWPRIGGVLAMAVGGTVALTARRMSRPQLLSAVNFGSLLVHQYEEYVDPGWFPGQFNRGLFKSDQPRNYPLNQSTALCVNTVFAYPFYIAPVLFPKNRWLGLAPAFFGMAQAVGHGITSPASPGTSTAPGSWPRSSCTFPSGSPTSAH
jgi:hypothetical protein